MGADDPEFTVQLPHATWMSVLESLGQRPYAEVAAVIENVAEQLSPQIRAVQAARDPRPDPVKAN